MAALEIWAAFGTLGVILGGHIIKSSSDKGKLQEKVDHLEEWKSKEEDKRDDILSISNHDRMQHACRAEIYRDMNRLEDNISKFIDKLDSLEDKRERKEDDQNRKIEEMYKTIIEINSHIKGTDKIGAY